MNTRIRGSDSSHPLGVARFDLLCALAWVPSCFMRLRKLLFIHCGLAVLSTSIACTQCTEEACGGGFSAKIEAPAGQVLSPATYAVTLIADEHTWTYTCIVAEAQGMQSCATDTPNIPNAYASVSVLLYSASDPATAGKPLGFLVTSSFVKGDDTLGPKTVNVSITRDGHAFFQRAAQPVYTLEEINGEGCGWCESQVVESWPIQTQ